MQATVGARARASIRRNAYLSADRRWILRGGTRRCATAAGGARTRLLCGAIRFEHPAARNLIGAPPVVIQLDAAPPQTTLAAEMREPQPSGEAIITRLADVLVI